MIVRWWRRWNRWNHPTDSYRSPEQFRLELARQLRDLEHTDEGKAALSFITYIRTNQERAS